ncbi:MAG: PKD domain-containing protein, partial [Flavobacteriales bacterium]
VSTWSFGDGNQSTAQNPVYTYYQPGIYTVSLNVVGPDGSSNTMTQEQIIYVYANATASFAVTPTNVNVPGEPVYCLNLSANASSYYWNFGDGETSTEENPLHYYQERGEYDITLIAVNGNGCSDTLTLLGLIEANDVGEIEFMPLRPTLLRVVVGITIPIASTMMFSSLFIRGWMNTNFRFITSGENYFSRVSILTKDGMDITGESL